MKRRLIVFMVLGLMIGTVVAAEAKKRPGRVERGDGQALAGPVRMVAVVRGHTYYPSSDSDQVVIIARHGSGLDLANFDEHSHTLTSFQWTNGKRLFGSRPVAPNEIGAVRGVENLDLGRYRFFCTSHPEMRGLLEVRHI